MTDIVERLRDGCSCNIDETPCMAESECREAYEAADEITRLRAENGRLREALRGLIKTIDAPAYILREQQAIEGLGIETPLSRARAALNPDKESE